MRSVRALRREVRSVLRDANVPAYAMCDSWMRGHDRDFTRLLATKGLIGLTWPRSLGGRGASNLERLVVTEELLRVGAPVAAHWIADRQIGPAILRHGSQRLQREFLPKIAAGEVTFCLGMSESESGSDLAALRTKAVRRGDTFWITGRKIWTSHAHQSTHAYVLARTGGGDEKHEGLTEFVVDLATPGVEVRPIYDLSGGHHFNEMIFDDVAVPFDNVIGEIGNGWRQVVEQLAFERGGMERVLSSYPLLATILGDDDSPSSGASSGADLDVGALGTLVARMHTLRAVAHGVASAMDAGDAPTHRAALLKHLGTTFEGDVVEYARDAVGTSPDPTAGGLEGLLVSGLLAAPGVTLRGGTTEILLTMVGRQELSAKPAWRRGDDSDDLQSALDEALSGQERQDIGTGMPSIWDMGVELGWTGVGVPESAGGSGGGVRDLAVIAAALARHGQSAPIVGTAVAGRILTAAGHTVDASVPTVLALGSGLVVGTHDGQMILSGRQPRVPWARFANAALMSADGPDGEILVRVELDAPGVSVSLGTNLAGEPRDAVELVDVSLAADAIVGGQSEVDAVRSLTAVLHSAGIVGALEAATTRARDHVTTREQFGKPLASFQAVVHNIARMAAEVVSAKVAVEQGIAEVEAQGPGWRAAAGSIIASRAATKVARTAHQILGAMGITKEHDLHVATLLLWAWRDENVPERTLARRIGRVALAAGRDSVWNWCVQDSDQLGSTAGSPWRNE